jgi:hypothetical protein
MEETNWRLIGAPEVRDMPDGQRLRVLSHGVQHEGDKAGYDSGMVALAVEGKAKPVWFQASPDSVTPDGGCFWTEP